MTELGRSPEVSLTSEVKSGDLFPMADSPDPEGARTHAREATAWLDVLPPVADVLRENQREMLAKASLAMHSGSRRVLLQAPTGFGKTHLIAALVAAALVSGLRVLILATRTRLVRQIHERLEQFRVHHGVIAAAMPGYFRWSSAAQVASVDTLYRRCIATRKMPLPGADVVVFDEAHLALGESRRRLLDAYPRAFVFGVTATPAKTSGASLAEQFDCLILGPTVRELIASGHLVGPRIFAKPVMSAAELRAVKTDSKTGDFATGELSVMMRRPKLVGDVVTNWLRIANGKRTLVFACDKGHGAELAQGFRQAGISAEQLTDADSDDAREEAIGRLESGATSVLINCFLLSYGIDIPLVDCVVLARPTRSVVLYLQAVGRAMRTAPGKDNFVLIDHGRVIENLGLPTYDRDWSLSGENINSRARQELACERKSEDEKPRTCAECSCVWAVSDDGPGCPNCGWQPAPRSKPVEVTEADLEEIAAESSPEDDCEDFFRQAMAWYAIRWPDKWHAKQNSGRYWAWINTREKFKRPDDERIPSIFWKLMPAESIRDDVAGWLQSRLIRWAKSQKRSNERQPEPRQRQETISFDEAWERSQQKPRYSSEVPF